MITIVNLTERSIEGTKNWDFYIKSIIDDSNHHKTEPTEDINTLILNTLIITSRQTIEAIARADGSLLWSGEDKALEFVDYLRRIQDRNTYFVMYKEVLEYFDRLGEYYKNMVYYKDGKFFTLPEPE